MPFELTPEHLALREQRKAKKLKGQEAHASSAGTNVKSNLNVLLQRPWISLTTAKPDHDSLRVKILTFNLLAQCLVRRELFPTSRCLKASKREPMLHQELLSQDPDIMCLQEVDRLEKLIPVLERSHYSHFYVTGQGKKHGCMIAFKHSRFTKVSHHLVDYDQEEIRVGGDNRARQGRSFQTRNIGLILALKSTKDDDRGLIVATTHLFWHPKYNYERARQAGILVREIMKYRSNLRASHWPCVIAGDFNFTPDDPAYALLVGDPLSQEQKAKILDSQVVHVSVDPTVTRIGRNVSTDNDEVEEAVDPDRDITSARASTPADGLLSIPELMTLYTEGALLRSVYDIGLQEANHRSEHKVKTFGDRVPGLPGRRGLSEPEYTSYTHYWKTVLDYIFALDPVDRHCQVLGFLAPHKKENLVPGLPKDGVCGSDHISLVAELSW